MKSQEFLGVPSNSLAFLRNSYELLGIGAKVLLRILAMLWSRKSPIDRFQELASARSRKRRCELCAIAVAARRA